MANTRECSVCGKRLQIYEWGVCEKCVNKAIQNSKITEEYINYANLVESCYVSKAKIREIICKYSTETREGKMFFDFDYTMPFFKEIAELAGYDKVTRKRRFL